MAPPRIHRRLLAVESAPAAGAASMVWRASDPTPDRYGDRVFPGGMDLSHYERNPVLLWGHDSGAPPVGVGAVWVEGEELFLEPALSTTDARAVQLAAQIAAGEVRAVSIGFLSHESAENEFGGLDHTRTELLEISFVSVPANPNAVRIKSMPKINTKAEGDAAETPDENPILAELQAIRAELAALKEGANDEDEEAKAKKETPPEDEAKRAPAMTAKQIAEAIERGISDRMSNLPAAETRSDYSVGKDLSADPGISLARFVKAKAVAAMEHRPVRDVLKGWGDRHVTRALSQGSFADGGSLVHPEFAQEFIELLRNETVVRKAGARTVPMGASLTFGGQEEAATASYGGENDAIPASSPKTSQPLVLSEKKLTGLVPFSNDLIRNASRNAEAFVRDDLVRVVALAEDSNFLYGPGTQFAPKGIKLALASGHRYAMSAISTAGTPTIAEVKKELGKAKKKLKNSNIAIRNWVWLLNPTVEEAIRQATGPGAEGTNSLEREMDDKGTLSGHKFIVSNQIADTGTLSDLFLVAMDEVIIGESMALDVEVFPNGTYTGAGGVVISGVSTDRTVIRAIAKHDIGLRYDTAGICVTGVTWTTG